VSDRPDTDGRLAVREADHHRSFPDRHPHPSAAICSAPGIGVSHIVPRRVPSTSVNVARGTGAGNRLERDPASAASRRTRGDSRWRGRLPDAPATGAAAAAGRAAAIAGAVLGRLMSCCARYMPSRTARSISAWSCRCPSAGGSTTLCAPWWWSDSGCLIAGHRCGGRRGGC
jgi:hypothetical protein